MATPSSLRQPTVIPLGAKPAPTRMPGVVREPATVPGEALRQRFPDASPEAIGVIQGILADMAPGTRPVADWLGYGQDVQRQATGLLSERLSLLESAPLRTMPRHLARLHVLLAELLEAMEPGVLLGRRQPRKAWERAESEVRRLAAELSAGLPGLLATETALEALSHRAGCARTTVGAWALAADLLLAQLPEEQRSVLAGRQSALLSAEGLLAGFLAHIELDRLRVRNLAGQVQDGVLLRLPDLINHLATLSARPDETEHYLLREKLSSLISHFERK
ncbi:MAG: hypothetical protein ACM31P_07055 [Actinomycetota bacterium]